MPFPSMPFPSPPRTALALLLAAGLGAPAFAQDAPATSAPPADTAGTEAPATVAPISPDTVVATVNGRDITEGDLALAISAPRPGEPPQTPEQRRARALSDIIGVRALAAKGEEAGLANADLDRRVAFLRDRELHNAYLTQTIEPSITEALLRERYEQEVGRSEPVEEIRARHILLESEEDARAVIEELEGGADFAELARARSTGPSATTGGDLGYFGPGQMVPAFDAAARALAPGEFSPEPVQTQFGFHVIKVEDTRKLEPPAFEQVREQVRELVTRERYIETLRDARAAAEIEIVDEGLARLIGPANGSGNGAAGDATDAAPADAAPADTAPAAQ